ncbi:hypothetical protein [Alicyclobacillus dauci]|uniref:Uncharacterized protein n=1 Tax=Alicyclobacillus dauci TaxID=1475485 RepID=A0ABY6Z192_9BACL|nr:hypothetical protein [Alicyclobacillus dauci]WAH36617.1 hypothetical protein NZD86_20945 [Alicyclobacillus dauci]
MAVPTYMYVMVFAKLLILAIALLGGVPMLERFVHREEKELDGITRIVRKGAMRYVEIIPEAQRGNHNIAV